MKQMMKYSSHHKDDCSHLNGMQTQPREDTNNYFGKCDARQGTWNRLWDAIYDCFVQK